MQPMGNEVMNAPNTNATQRGKVNEQHQIVAELVVQRDPTMLSTTHKRTPRRITQPRVMNVYHDDNRERVQPFDEVVST